MKLTFLGAAGMVTGSCYLLETAKGKMLIDCGMFQGNKDTTKRNFEEFAFEPRKLSCVLLTHAHLDHSGLLPRLVKNGYRGPIYGTSATIDLAKIMLLDSAHVNAMDTQAENRRRRREGLDEREPLYTEEDAKTACTLFQKIPKDVMPGVSVGFRDSGHILGSASFILRAEGKSIVFSGDIGQWDLPIVEDPQTFEEADACLIESTYAGMHHDKADRDEELLTIIQDTYRKGGKLLIPCFAIERTQELLYALNTIEKRMPRQKIYLDSPLAIKATAVFKKHPECFDREAKAKKNPFSLKELECTTTTQQSMKINAQNKPCIVIAGNGMCTGGRIRHHLKHGIWDPRNTLLFVGYQADGTTGRYILSGADRIRMMGMELVVKADVRKINSFSGHADNDDLVKWASSFSRKPRFFIVHGDPDRAQKLQQQIGGEVAELGETVEV